VTVSADSVADGLVTVPGRAEQGRSASTLTGWFDLLRLLLRRDRIQLFIWIAAVAALVLVSAASLEGLYPDQKSLEDYASLVQGNAAVVVQAGPGYGLASSPTIGSVLMNETSMWTIILVGIMSIFLVTRHTRAEEESDRAELLRSAPVGRHASGAATMAGALVANVAAATAVAAGLLLGGFDAVGTLAFAATLVGAGMVFAGITLVTAQVASSGRATTGMALSVLGVSFVLRAIGDVTGNGMSWLSPIGWGQAIRAFADERWWVLLLPVGATVLLAAAASSLAGHRDFGSGMLPDRAGRSAATRWLATPLGLAGRLQRGALIGWMVGVAVFGAFYGAVTNEVDRMVADNPELEAFFAQAGGGSITDSFLASAATILALVVGGAVLSGVLRLRGEEIHGRVEPLLATPTSRSSWATSHLFVAIVGGVAVAVFGGLGLGVGAAVVTDNTDRIMAMLTAMLAFVPAVAVLGAFAFALWGVVPRFALLSWAGLVWAAVVGLFGEVFDLPQWARDASPLEHVPALPAAEMSARPLIVLTLVAIALCVTGFLGLRNRDISA
jgi:ABC-2 type transport system permease protein